ncbi:hypothetical protein J6590_068784 [Homalodisca vitripennis]|nr:hypothetical protein J6590_068784 [Homalodisca vitripennis]
MRKPRITISPKTIFAFIFGVIRYSGWVKLTVRAGFCQDAKRKDDEFYKLTLEEVKATVLPELYKLGGNNDLNDLLPYSFFARTHPYTHKHRGMDLVQHLAFPSRIIQRHFT